MTRRRRSPLAAVVLQTLLVANACLLAILSGLCFAFVDRAPGNIGGVGLATGAIGLVIIRTRIRLDRWH